VAGPYAPLGHSSPTTRQLHTISYFVSLQYQARRPTELGAGGPTAHGTPWVGQASKDRHTVRLSNPREESCV
jgi:hypothetical protein